MVHDADFAAVVLQPRNLETQCRLPTPASNLLLDAMDKFTQHSLVVVVGQLSPITVDVAPTVSLTLTSQVR